MNEVTSAKGHQCGDKSKKLYMCMRNLTLNVLHLYLYYLALYLCCAPFSGVVELLDLLALHLYINKSSNSKTPLNGAQ
jgi:hypothetical protein